MTKLLVAAVTGANKGIGYAIVRKLALEFPASPLAQSGAPLLVYLTARAQDRGEAALASIHADPDLAAAKALTSAGGRTDVRFRQLDISDLASITAFEEFLQAQHPEGIDILVNNAGVALDGFNAGVVEQTLAANYRGTLHLTRTLLPHVRAGGRVVNVSSLVGKLNKYSPEVTDTFRNATSVEQITGLMDRFLESVRAGRETQDGFPSSAYAVSKAGVTGMTRVLGKSEEVRRNGVLLNACCPGYVNTDMTKGRGKKTVDEGAALPVKLALQDIGGVSGEFWQHDEVEPW